ncbi:MAG: GIY-YIG nuclease family protein [Candidatus Saccharimonadales bacterium]
MGICKLPECDNKVKIQVAGTNAKKFCCKSHQEIMSKRKYRKSLRKQNPFEKGICSLPGCNNIFEFRHGGRKQKYCQRSCAVIANEAQRKQRRDKNSHNELTYLMFSPGLGTYKIGQTINMTSRISSLRNGCWDIELVTTFPYDRKLEKYLHRKFKAHRIPGTEWFKNITETEVKNSVVDYEIEISEQL